MGLIEQKTKKSNMNEFGDSIAIDDEHKLPADQPVPMALEQTEPVIIDLDEMVFLSCFLSLFLLFIKSIWRFNLSC